MSWVPLGRTARLPKFSTIGRSVCLITASIKAVKIFVYHCEIKYKREFLQYISNSNCCKEVKNKVIVCKRFVRSAYVKIINELT